MKKDAINKKIFRGMRNSLMKEFDAYDLARGKHHWDGPRWIAQTRRFMELIGLDTSEELDVFKTMVLISSTKISKKTPERY
jgi:hypothetical protein